jgi:chemotaxis protein MotA
MDLMCIAGLLITLCLVIGGIVTGGAPEAFINFPSILITVGGTVGTIIMATPVAELKKVPASFRKVFSKGSGNDSVGVVKKLVLFSRKARSDGLLALEEEANSLPNPFIRKSIQLVVDGTAPELVRSILDSEIDLLERRNAVSRKVFDLASELAPAFGMLGTLIGLIQMLRNLDDPGALGPGMAVALLTTFYGSFIANVIAIPMSRKLASQSAREILHHELIVEGVLSIQAGENPRVVEEKLKVFLPLDERDKLEEQNQKRESAPGQERSPGGVPA